MTEPSSAAPPQKSSPFPWIIGGCGCLLFGLAIVFGGIFTFVMKATEEPEKVVKEFLAASAAGDAERAWATFAPEMKQVQPLEDFSAVLAANPQLFDVADVSYSNRGVQNDTATFTGTAKLGGGGEIPCDFTLRKYDDGWKIIAWHLGGGAEE